MMNKQQLPMARVLTVMIAFALLLTTLLARPAFAQTAPINAQPAVLTVSSAEMQEGDVSIDEAMLIDPMPFFYENDPYQLAAKTIGIDVEVLWNEWYAGKSLADMATVHDVSVEIVINVIAEAQTKMIDQSFADGYLTEGEAAAQRLTTVDEATKLVNIHYIAYPDLYAVAAELIGVEVETVYQLQGQSITQLAAEHGIDEATLTKTLTDALSAYTDAIVADGQLSAEDAQYQRQFIDEQVNSTIHWVYIAYPDVYQLIADLTGSDVEEIYTAWANGQSLAEFAQSKGVSLQTVTDALTTAYNHYYDEMVKTEQLSAQDAATMRETIADEIARTISTHNIAYPDPYQNAAELLGITQEELFSALEAGKTIAQLAEERNIDVQTIIDSLVAAENRYIDQLIADGQLSEEDATSWRESIIESNSSLVNNSWDYPQPMLLDEMAVESATTTNAVMVK